MTEARRCGSCGSELEAEASPQGLCARCLLEAGLKTSQTTSDGLQETSPGSPPSADPGPIDPAQLARLFPQLDIQKLLGRGGMGAVYLARQKALDRRVALKLLTPKPGLDAEFAERFSREARALARLNHPGIVAIYDFGQTEGLYYFLMEYVDGTSLREVMREGKLPPRQALSLVPQICDALQYAHDEGVVHRDIKPENILIDKKGRIKIADFGLAKLLGPAAQEDGLTGSHHVMGTRNYMAPEQLERPKQVDHRADIYSLGVVFYEMLTGELPLGRFAPPSQKVHVDVRLDEVVLRALEKEPERRYQHASEIKTDVQDIPTPDSAVTERADQPGPEGRPSFFAIGPAGSWWPSRLVLVPVALAVYALSIWAYLSTGDRLMSWMALCYLDDLLANYFRTPKVWSLLRRPHRSPWRYASFVYLAAIFLLAVLLSNASSFIWVGLFAALLLGLAVTGGVRAVSAKTPEERAGGLLILQTAGITLFFYPALRPLDYFSWVYKLSETKPKPEDVLALQIVFGAALAPLLAWKIQTFRALRHMRHVQPVNSAAELSSERPRS